MKIDVEDGPGSGMINTRIWVDCSIHTDGDYLVYKFGDGGGAWLFYRSGGFFTSASTLRITSARDEEIVAPVKIEHVRLADPEFDDNDEEDDDSYVPQGHLWGPNVEGDEPSSRGFSKANKPGRFHEEHANVRLPATPKDPRAQAASNMATPAFRHVTAWRYLWAIAFTGFFLLARTQMQYDVEAGVQTMLSVIFAACVALIGSDVKLQRERVLKGTTCGGPVEFLFLKSGVYKFIVEVKNHLSSDYLTFVEQMYAQLFAAGELNGSQSGHVPIWGVLMDAGGAVMFRYVPAEKKITCGRYVSVFDGELPACDLPLWLLYVL